MALPRPRDMFGADEPLEITNRFEAYKEELNKALDNPRSLPGPTILGDESVNPLADFRALAANPQVSKAINPATLESLQTQLEQTNLNKDINLTGGPFGSPGLVAIDLEAPAKMLAPRPTPMRNRIPRRQGRGTAHQYRVITGFTGTGTGGVGLMRPGITESTTTTFGSVPYLRGPKIQYSGFSASVPYLQFSVSDQVSWAAQFSGQGFQDIRQLSQTSVLYSSMLLEEREILGGRGTSSGFLGALAAPSGVALTPRTAAAGETALSGVTTNIYVLVTAEAMWGESVLSAVVNAAPTGTQVVDVTVGTLPAGATGFRVYVGTGAANPGNAAIWYAGRSGGSTFTLQGALPTSGTAASTITADTSASAQDYDGILTYVTGPNSGYVSRLNGPLSTANPGTEFFTAFGSMYDSVKADPDEVLANGNDRKQLSDALKKASTTGYRIVVDSSTAPDGVHNATLGALVSGLQNEVTGKMVDVTVHPWMPQGVMPILSWTLPLPDSNVSDVWTIWNVQDYMSVSWPIQQFAYEVSSYWYGTLVCYAPGWNGCITGVNKV